MDYAVPLLDILYGDSARFVTRSVANHVNDITKLDPDLALDMLQRWRSSGRQYAKEMDYVVWHATRTLLKQGNARAMELLGVPRTSPSRSRSSPCPTGSSSAHISSSPSRSAWRRTPL
jgi:3-methyladenine DNA glycosylase AlkC